MPRSASRPRPTTRCRPSTSRPSSDGGRCVLGVAAEEMLHWALVNNLLTAVGSAPYVARPHMPAPGQGLPGRGAARPRCRSASGRSGTSSSSNARRHGARRRRGASALGAGAARSWPRPTSSRGARSSTPSGHLYRSIQAGIRNLAERLGEDRLFIGPHEAQATPESFRWPQLVPITDVGDRRAGHRRHRRAGRGARGRLERRRTTAASSRSSTSYLAIKAADPTFEPAHPVIGAGVRPVDGVLPDV